MITPFLAMDRAQQRQHLTAVRDLSIERRAATSRHHYEDTRKPEPWWSGRIALAEELLGEKSEEGK